MAGAEGNDASTPVPPVDSKPADAGPSGMVTPSTAGSTPQGSLDQPAPLRCSVQKTTNDFHGGTGISVYRQIPVHPTSGMHELVSVSISMSYSACTPFSGRVQCE